MGIGRPPPPPPPPPPPRPRHPPPPPPPPPHRRLPLPLLLLLLLLAAAAPRPPAGAGEEAARPPDLVVRKWLALDSVDARGRAPFNPNTPFLRFLLDRDGPPPKEGEVVKGTSGEAPWRPVEAKEDGSVEDERGAWFYGEVEGPAGGSSVHLAHLDRAGALFVNGAGFPGDVYGLGTGPVPVELRPGVNRLFVVGPRGPWRLRFEPWKAGRSPVLAEDATLPDPVAGEEEWEGEGSVRLLNPSTEWKPAPWIGPGGPGSTDPPPPEWSPALPLAPLWTGKAAVDLGPWGLLRPGNRIAFSVGPGSPPTDFSLDVRRPGEARRVTFTSAMDGTVQYYAVLDPSGAPAAVREVATVLSLHGASVEAIGQARSYSPRPGVRIVAPTNRRPFGFDWQDWGRTDAYEVLSRVLALPDADPDRVFLTGHSMGGHGTWHLAANDPDRWAAIAPSAGWCSFDTYGGGPRPETELSPIWRGADGGSRTEDLIPNLVPLPTFVLHGTADDNVPLSEAEGMIARLEKAGGRPLRRFQEGAGHWWDGEAAPGADCVDGPWIFDLFARSRSPEAPEEIDFLSADPAVDALHHWVMAFQPLVYGRPLRVKGRRAGGKVVLDTENVRTLSLLHVAGVPSTDVVIDGAAVPSPASDGVDTWSREGKGWTAVRGVDPAEKNPGRSGPFKRAFGNAFVLVVPTRGTESGNRENLELARYHASLWWYRANGSAPVVRDVDLLARPGEFRGRNVVLYGNADDNAAWSAVLPESCPVEVRRGSVRVGDRTWEGDDLGALLVHPRRGEDDSLAAAFASTGDRGTRVGYGLLPFTSGVGYPDWAVYGSGFLGSGDGGVRAAGWFDHRWGLQGEGSFFREERR